MSRGEYDANQALAEGAGKVYADFPPVGSHPIDIQRAAKRVNEVLSGAWAAGYDDAQASKPMASAAPNAPASLHIAYGNGYMAAVAEMRQGGAS